jgi:NADH:ubiquinone oxidoreductase subunit K
MSPSPLTYVLIGVVGLFGVGLYGLLAVRNLIKTIVALQILAKSALLALVAAGSAAGVMQLAQSTAVTLIVADTIVAVVGLALAVQVRRRTGTLDVSGLSSLKG